MKAPGPHVVWGRSLVLMAAFVIAPAPVPALSATAETPSAHVAVVTREEVRYVMGTVATVSASAPGEATALAALDAAWAARDPVAAPRDLFQVVSAALHWADETDGAFDPTVLPLLRAWGLQGGEPHEPTEDELARTLAVTGAHHVRVDTVAGTIGFAREGVALDLGGIAKGYALDCAREAMTAAGAVAGVLDLGGNLLVFGSGREQVGIVDPGDPTRTVATIAVVDAAVATSGQYERHVEVGGRRRGHILDPRTGVPVDRQGSVTIVAPRGIDADALSTAVFVLGVEAGEELVRRHSGTGCVFVVPAKGGGWAARRSGTLLERP